MLNPESTESRPNRDLPHAGEGVREPAVTLDEEKGPWRNGKEKARLRLQRLGQVGSEERRQHPRHSVAASGAGGAP